MNYLLIVLQIANFSQLIHLLLEELSHTKMKNCEYLGKAISCSAGDTHRGSGLVKHFCLPKNAYISKTVLDGVNSTKFLTCWVSLQSSYANFQNIFVSPNIADILNFRIFCKTQKCLYLENRAR